MNVSCVQRCPVDTSIHCNSLQPAHEIAILVGLSCNEGSDELAKIPTSGSAHALELKSHTPDDGLLLMMI